MLNDNFMAESLLSERHPPTHEWPKFWTTGQVTDLLEQMPAFRVKLGLLTTDLSTSRMLHFLKCTALKAQITDVVTDFISVATEGDFSSKAKEAVPSLIRRNSYLNLSCNHY